MTLNVTITDHDEVHSLDPELLGQGPICLVPATACPPVEGQPIDIRPGIWVFDAALGDVTLRREWLADGIVLTDRDGTRLDHDPALAGQPLVHVETVMQGGHEVARESVPVGWPAAPVEWQITADRRVILQDAGRHSGPIAFGIGAPAAYAGDHLVRTSELGQGPCCVVGPAILGQPQQGATLEPVPGLWASLSDDVQRHGEWFVDGLPTGTTQGGYTVDPDRDGGRLVTYRETVADAFGQRHADSAALLVPQAAPAPDDGWHAPLWQDASPPRAGTTRPGADGAIEVVTKAGNLSGSPRVCFDVEPGQTYQLETAIEFGDASRVVGRLSDMTGYNDDINVTVFDLRPGAGQTRLWRSDTFTPTAGRIAMHLVFVMGTSGTARILPETRIRKVN